jgi:hypothetical protein
MLKRRIHKWGLDKNNKERDMKAIADLVEQRSLRGRSPIPAVRLGRRNILLSEVARYFRRKRMKRPESLVTELSAGSGENIARSLHPGDATSCQDLPYVAGTSRRGISSTNVVLAQEISTGYQQASCSHATLTTPFCPTDWIDHSLPATIDEVMTHTIIGGAQRFCTAWMDQVRSVDSARATPPFFYQAMALRSRAVIANLRCGSYKTAFEFLNDIHESLRLRVSDIDPTTLVLVLCFVHDLERGGMQLVAQRSLEYFRNLSEIAYGVENPIRIVTHSLLRVASDMRVKLIHATLSHIGKTMEQDFSMRSRHRATRETTNRRTGLKIRMRSRFYADSETGAVSK